MTPERKRLLSEYARRIKRERDMTVRPPLTRARIIDANTQMQQLVIRSSRQARILSSDVGVGGVGSGDVGLFRFTPGFSYVGTDFIPSS